MGYDDDTAPSTQRSTTSEGSMIAKRYYVLGRLGYGGMGTVYRVHDTQLDQEIALKLLDRDADESDQERFRREVKIARKVTHPNVVRTFDFGTHEGRAFLTMELVRGESLDRRLRSDPPSYNDILRIGTAVAEGLAAAHQLGVVHRDLKPGNIMLAEDGRILLTDFGIARSTVDPKTHATGVILGTPDYMAPEQVNDRPIGPATDMFALGVLLYELVAGVCPFGGNSPIEVALARLHETPKRLTEVAPGVDPDLSGLVQRLLARQPDERPRARATAQRLRFIAQDDTGGSSISLEIPLVIEGPRLLVVPFRYRGNPQHALLGEGLAEELVDVLSQTRGLRVTLGGSSGASAMRLAKEDEADYVVSGSVQVHGDQMRLRLRLAKPDGEQVWSESFDARIEELFELEERMARRLAESLRVQVTTFGLAGAVPSAVIERYLEAKRLMRGGPMQIVQAARLLDQACEIQPPVTTVVALRALAHAMASCFGPTVAPDAERRVQAQEALDVARRIAPKEPETHLANAAWARESCSMEEELDALLQVLEVAPTNTEAHLALARLQLRADRTRIARRRFELVEELGAPPAVYLGRLHLAAYEGDDAEAQRFLEAAEQELGRRAVAVQVARLRLAMWTGKLEVLAAIQEAQDSPGEQMVAAIAAMARGELALDWKPMLERLRPWPATRVEMALVLTEAAITRGEPDEAMKILMSAAERLHDLHWLRHNPLAQTMHDRKDFQFLLSGIRAVVDASFQRNAGVNVTLG